MRFEKSNLIDDIFLCQFSQTTEIRNTLKYIYASLTTPQELSNILPKYISPVYIYKDIPFYILFDEKDFQNQSVIINDLIKNISTHVKDFIEVSSLKKCHPKMGESKKVSEINNLFPSQNIIYHCEAYYKIDSCEAYLSIIIPKNTLDILIRLILHKNTSSVNDFKDFYHILSHLRTDFYRKNLQFPFNVIDFLNILPDSDLQRVLGIMLSNNLMSYDMLWALGTKMDNGIERISNNLSRNQQEEFQEAIKKNNQNPDYRWVEIAIYQIGLSLDEQIKEKRIDSPHILRLKSIIHDIYLKELKYFFLINPFEQWIEKAIEEGIIQNVLSQCNDLNLAKSFVKISPDSMSLVVKNLSKRKYQLMIEDIEYQKKNISPDEIILAQYEFVKTFINLNYNNLSQDEKKLEYYLPRFKTINDLDFVVNTVGPIEFCLASLTLPIQLKQFLVKNLKPPIKYFISYFLLNKIKLNFPYGEHRIDKAVQHVIKTIYQLEQENKISLKTPVENVSETNTSNFVQ